MNRRGFLRSFAATAAGVLVPADALTSPGRPGIYFLSAAHASGWLLMLDMLVTPEAIERGEKIDVPLPAGWPPTVDRVDFRIARIGDVTP